MRNSKFIFSRGSFIRRTVMLFFFAVCLFLYPATGNSLTNIKNTKHNLSSSGPGAFRALTENRICVFCHTPHNATPNTPLWNKEIEPQTYTFYTSTSLKSTVPAQPTGPTKLCLSCHDGTLALGAVVNPAGGITLLGGVTTMPWGSPSHLGLNFSNHHPVSFSYYSALPNDELVSVPPGSLVFGGGDAEFHCTTCHDPHDDTNGKFLAADNRYSALCVTCHMKNGWDISTHKSSTKTLLSPLPGTEWTNWTSVSDYGCEGCHQPHSAGGPWLLRNLVEEDNCYTCHDGTVAGKNILAQFQKSSRHPVEATTGDHDPMESPTLITNRHVECTDCHNPHAANDLTASAPDVSGRLKNVTGMTIGRAAVDPANYEYEICFKCHAELSQMTPLITRVINNTNTQESFSIVNPSYHPVAGMGKNPDVPSIPSALEPSLTESSIIYCSDCHSDDSGSRGPHGSSFAPILRERYETTDGAVESYENYALCYRCHDRTSILSDASFEKKILKTTLSGGGHNGHLAAGAPCSVCHDSHGIVDDGLSGSHTNLINFDTSIVFPAGGNTEPIFVDTGAFSGSCTLICHGRAHNNESYP